MKDSASWSSISQLIPQTSTNASVLTSVLTLPTSIKSARSSCSKRNESWLSSRRGGTLVSRRTCLGPLAFTRWQWFRPDREEHSASSIQHLVGDEWREILDLTELKFWSNITIKLYWSSLQGLLILFWVSGHRSVNVWTHLSCQINRIKWMWNITLSQEVKLFWWLKLVIHLASEKTMKPYLLE